MLVWIAGAAAAQSWTVFEGPSAITSCTGKPKEYAGILEPYCPDFLNTALAVSDGGNYLFVWEKTEQFTILGPNDHAVRYRHYDSALGAYSGSRATLVAGKVGGEGHSPSVDWAGATTAKFVASHRVSTAAGGRVLAAVRLTEAVGAPPTLSALRLIDPDERLCPACDHGTTQLYFDDFTDRLYWAFTWQHPDGANNERFDEAYGTWIEDGDTDYLSANLTRIDGDFPDVPGTSDPAMSCADLEAIDGSDVSVDPCFGTPIPEGAPYHAQHHPYWTRRDVTNGLIALWMDWSSTPNSIWAGFYTGPGSTLDMKLSSGDGKAAEAVSTIGQDGYFHAAWKQRTVEDNDLFNDLMYRYCTGTNAECGLGLGLGHWVPDNPAAPASSVFQVNTVDGSDEQIESRFVEVVGVVSTPAVAPATAGAVYLAFEARDYIDPDGPGDLPEKHYRQIFVTSACLGDTAGSPAPLVWSAPSAPDPIENAGDVRTFGSRTFENLVVDPVNDRVVVSWIATDYDPEALPREATFEVRWAHTPFRSCAL